MALRARGRWNTSEVQLSCLTFFIIVLEIQGHCLLNSEGLALFAFRAAVDSDPYGALSDWNPNDCNPCMWSGVHCVDGQVQMLNLNGLSLEGVLAPDIGKLTNLRILVLAQNQFSGSIPKEFGGLAMLELLDLRNNSLNGTIPTEIGAMPLLKCLLLHNNKFEEIATSQHGNVDMPSELQSDGSPVSAATEFGYQNRKFGHCISYCDILSLKKAEAFMKTGPLVKAELLSTQIKETLNRYLHMLPSLKSEGGPSYDNTEICCDNLPSSFEPHIKNLFTLVRRRLVEQSSNVAALPASGASAAYPIIALPSTRSSGSFPAVPKEKKKLSPSPAPSPAEPPQEPGHTFVLSGNTADRSGGHSGNNWKYIAGILVAVFVALAATVLFFVCRTRAVTTMSPWRTGLSGQLQKAFVTGVPKLNRNELETACEDFSNIIATHDSCTIYKGTLSSGVEISVVSTSIATRKEWSKRSENAYRKQIASLSRINHKNFVNLIGYCEEEEPFTRMMVFEFCANGSLFEHLHIMELEHLDWNARMRIIMGTAYCLQYMHDLNPSIPHSNIISNAIFLSEDYAAKVAEIGFWYELSCKSRVSTDNDSRGSTNCNLPPHADVETNIYTFGVLLLEVVSGRLRYSEEQGHLVDWASEYLMDKRKFNYIIDPTLKSFRNNELEVICEVVQECIQQDTRKRPSAREVVSKLREVINISRDVATPSSSPLWWAELEILSAEAA